VSDQLVVILVLGMVGTPIFGTIAGVIKNIRG
jgi:hypothetical protein